MSSQSMTVDEESLVRRVLKNFPVNHDQACLDRPAYARGFSGAIIVRVRTGQVTYCLRRWPSRELPRRRLVELHRFLRFVNGAGVNVLPVPVQSCEGETLIECDGSLWQLESWMPGVADFSQDPTDLRLESIMRLLARLHIVASQYEPTDAGREWFGTHPTQPSPTIGERIAVIDHWTPARVDHALSILGNETDQSFREVAAATLQRYREFHAGVRADLASVSQSAVIVHPCLRDVWHDHVLYTDDEVTGLIDPTATRTESVACDLSRLLGSLLGESAERRSSALETYERVRPLSTTEHQLIRTLNTSGVLLSGLTWIDRRMSDGIDAEMLPRVVERMNAIRKAIDTIGLNRN